MVTYPYDWNILEYDKKIQNKQINKLWYSISFRMHCKIVFNFALRHDLALLQDNRLLALHVASWFPLANGRSLDWLNDYLCEIYIMVADLGIK